MKILLFGYYGFHNLGDEAILKALIENIPRVLPFAEITVVSKQPAQTEATFGVKAADRSLAAIGAAIKNCDVFMLGGGGLLQDSTSLRSLLVYLYLINLAKKRGKKVVLLAQGIGPIKSRMGQYFSRRILNKVDLITVRDNFSYSELSRLKLKNPEKIFITADVTPVLFFPVANAPTRGSPQTAAAQSLAQYLQVGIAARTPLNHGHSLAQTLATAADRLIEQHHAQISFLPMQPRDHAFINRIRKMMKNPARTLELTLENACPQISELNLVIGVRLHALIFAALLGIPCIALNYDPKVAAFAEFMGIPSLSLDKIKPSPSSQLLEELLQTITATLDQPDAIAEKLRNRTDTLKQNAWLNFNLLASFLSTFPKVTILGTEINKLTMFDAVNFCRHAIGSNVGQSADGPSRKTHQIITVNPELVYQAAHDPALRQFINSVELKTADGAGLLWAAKYLKRPLPERITGIDLLYQIFALANRHGYRIFLLGSTKETISKAAANIQQTYPNLNIVGWHDGYFNIGNAADSELAVKEKIKAARPDILIVGMGAPKQDYWITQNKDALGVPLSIGVGGSFDIISGLKKRAPQWIQKIRAEWVYRLLKEPWRIRRQINLFKFMWLVRKERHEIELP
jgi:N-acetylglucosaminyldiphosphoundecaprenol N-acetyl-beta-D-mannosaminyltransferase